MDNRSALVEALEVAVASKNHGRASEILNAIAKHDGSGSHEDAAAGQQHPMPGPDGAVKPADDEAKHGAATQAKFRARRFEGLLPIHTKHLDRFMTWDCAPVLLSLGMFGTSAAAQEVTESVAMLRAAEQNVPSLASSAESVTAIVIGDGSKPRTAAILAMRTRWRRILSIDPALDAPMDAPGGFSPFGPTIDRLWVASAKIQDLEISTDTEHVVVMLPHCHVVPDGALRSLRMTPSSPEGTTPRLSVLQMPCCAYVWHDKVQGSPADLTFEDTAVAASCRTIRVWRDVKLLPEPEPWRPEACWACGAPGHSKASCPLAPAEAAEARRAAQRGLPAPQAAVRELRAPGAADRKARKDAKRARREAKLAARGAADDPPPC